MSDENGSERLLAGHAPAVMVGGMRVGGIRPKHNSESSSTNSSSVVSDEEKNTTSASNESSTTASSTDKNNNKLMSQSKPSAAGMVVNGVVVDIKEAFPTEAVRQMHERHQQPQHQMNFRINNKRAQMHAIFQPSMQPSK